MTHTYTNLYGNQVKCTILKIENDSALVKNENGCEVYLKVADLKQILVEHTQRTPLPDFLFNCRGNGMWRNNKLENK